MSRKPIFIDRDGVLNADVSPYISRLEQVQLFPWTVDALEMLDKAGFDIFVISNQQGVALGITSLEVLESIMEMIQETCRERGFAVRKFYHCTALDSDDHPWRKPKPGMILAAGEEFGLDVAGTFFIGDKWSDIESGARAGCRPLLVLSGVTGPDAWQNWKYQPERVFPTLREAAEWVADSGK